MDAMEALQVDDLSGQDSLRRGRDASRKSSFGLRAQQV